MIPSLTREDLKIIGYNLGRVGNLFSVLMLVPTIVAAAYKEFDIIPHFIAASAVAFILSNLAIYFFHTKNGMELKHAVCVAALVWIFGMLLTAVPLWSTRSTGSYLDANFDTMSGFTTTGLTLIPDIDHLPHSINFFRHYLQFIGGIGIIVVTITVLAKSEMGSVLAFKAEAREEGIRPSVVRTSRMILGIAITFMVLGAVLLAIVGISEGMNVGTSIFDGVAHSMSGFATGGFSTHSQSILFYHSVWYEVVALILIIVGGFNFAFHYTVLSGKRSEVFKNIEIKTFFITLMLSTLIIAAALLFFNVYSSPDTLFRKAFFQAASAHTGTGFATVHPLQMSGVWPNLPQMMIAMIMLLGACANSTCGGIKAIRIGILVKAFFNEIKKTLSPKSAFVREKYHHISDTPLTDTIARGAALIAIGYIFLFFIGTAVTMLYGYGATDSMYDTSSALGNVGLSSGVTSPAMPPGLKVTYIFLMWAGRLEIMAVLALIGFVILALRRGIKR